MFVIQGDCDKCGFCILECPVEAIVDAGRINRIVPEKCVECGACVPVCPLQVIVERPATAAPGEPAPQPR